MNYILDRSPMWIKRHLLINSNTVYENLAKKLMINKTFAIYKQQKRDFSDFSRFTRFSPRTLVISYFPGALYKFDPN